MQNDTSSPEPTAQSSCSSSQPSPTPSPPPSTPPATPSAPHRPRRHPDDNAGGASQSSGYYFLRSSPESVNPLHSLHEQLHGSWKTLQRKSSQIAADLLQVPPPGWKPPKDPRAPPKPPTALQRAARAAKRELYGEIVQIKKERLVQVTDHACKRDAQGLVASTNIIINEIEAITNLNVTLFPAQRVGFTSP